VATPTQQPRPERTDGIDDIPVWTRRGVVFGMCVAAAAALTVGERLLFPTRRRLGEVEEEAPRGSLAWALALASAPEPELWRERHEFVWVAVAHPGVESLRPGLDRLTDLAFAAGSEAGDSILGHVANALRGHGDRPRLEALAKRLGTRDDLAKARRQATRVLAEMGR